MCGPGGLNSTPCRVRRAISGYSRHGGAACLGIARRGQRHLMTSWEISVILKVTERTVNKHMADAMTKLKAVTRAQAVAIAIRNGEIGM